MSIEINDKYLYVYSPCLRHSYIIPKGIDFYCSLEQGVKLFQEESLFYDLRCCNKSNLFDSLAIILDHDGRCLEEDDGDDDTYCTVLVVLSSIAVAESHREQGMVTVI